MKYYKGQAKCGHVSRNRYIPKWFYEKAETKKEAAKKIREEPRVKHDRLDAIINIVEISFDEYLVGLKIMKEDEYYSIKNSSEQKIYNAKHIDEIYYEEKPIKYKKNRNGQHLKNEFRAKEMDMRIQKGLIYDE